MLHSGAAALHNVAEPETVRAASNKSPRAGKYTSKQHTFNGRLPCVDDENERHA
jgi:hypothetical protein